MGRGKGNVAWEEHTELLQYLLYIFNTVFFCGGALVFAIALWIRFDNDMNDFVEGLGMYHYWNGSNVVMVGATLVMLNCFVACCGVYTSSRPMIIIAAGAAVFALCLWIRFDKDMDEYVNSLGMFFYWNATNTIMFASTMVMINCFLGCCGSYFSNRPVVITYIVMTFITFIMLLAGSAYTLANGLESTNIYPWIQERMRELIHQYQWDVAARRSVDIVQEYVGCCGGYSSSDFTDIHLPVPNTCRDQVTGNQYGDSCAEIFSQYLEVRTGWLTGLSLSLCFFQCFAVMISVCMYMAIKEREDMKRGGI